MTDSGRLRATRRANSVDFDHLEIFLGRAAVRAGPGIGNVGPTGTGLDAFIRQTQRLVIDEATDDTHPFAKGDGFVGALIHRGLLAMDNKRFILATPPPMRKRMALLFQD